MPSHNQSSRRRSSSRRSSSRGGKSKGKAIVKKTAAHDGVDFLTTLIGFICGLTVLLLVISSFSSPKLNADILAANDENRADIATTLKKRDFDTFVENASIEKLAEILTSMNEKKKFESEGKFRTNFVRQQKIIDRMMEEPLSEDYRRLAVLTRITSTGTMFWTNRKKNLGESDLGIRLRELVEPHKDDSDPEISFESRIQLARLNSLDAPKQVVPHAKELYRLLADFPTNERVNQEIIGSMLRLLQDIEKRAAVPKVLAHFLKQPKVVGDQKTEVLYSKLSDLWNLCDRDFFSVRENVLYAGKAGRDQLRDVCLDLTRIPTAGKEILEHVLKCGYWMETNDHYDHAIEIYTALTAGGKNLSEEKDVLKVEILGKWGVRRCEAVGKPFDLKAKLYDGVPFNVKAIKSMPVLLVFYSQADGTDNVLYQVERASRRWQGGSVKIIAVQVERDKSNFDRVAVQKQKEQLKRWDFFFDDGTGAGPIFSQVPSVRNGRCVLLDRQHKVYDVNVGLPELATAVNSVLAIRSEESEVN